MNNTSLTDLHAVLRGETTQHGVHGDSKTYLLAIDIDKLSVADESLPGVSKYQSWKRQQRERNPALTEDELDLCYRVLLAADLMRGYLKQAFKDRSLPIPTMVAYRTNGDFPTELARPIVESGGTFWRYRPETMTPPFGPKAADSPRPTAHKGRLLRAVSWLISRIRDPRLLGRDLHYLIPDVRRFLSGIAGRFIRLLPREMPDRPGRHPIRRAPESGAHTEDAANLQVPRPNMGEDSGDVVYEALVRSISAIHIDPEELLAGLGIARSQANKDGSQDQETSRGGREPGS